MFKIITDIKNCLSRGLLFLWSPLPKRQRCQVRVIIPIIISTLTLKDKIVSSQPITCLPHPIYLWNEWTLLYSASSFVKFLPPRAPNGVMTCSSTKDKLNFEKLAKKKFANTYIQSRHLPKESMMSPLQENSSVWPRAQAGPSLLHIPRHYCLLCKLCCIIKLNTGKCLSICQYEKNYVNHQITWKVRRL